MGAYPAKYRGGETVCIGDIAELRLPDGRVQQVRIGTLDYLLNQEVLFGRLPQADLPMLHLFTELHTPAWHGVMEYPSVPMNPADMRLIRRSDKIFYNDGREMLPGDIVWDSGMHQLLRFEGVWRKDNPEHAWYFEQNPDSAFVLSFDSYAPDGYGYICDYADAEGHRTAGMDHLIFVERAPRAATAE